MRERILFRLSIECLFAASATEEGSAVKFRFVLRCVYSYRHSANRIFGFFHLRSLIEILRSTTRGKAFRATAKSGGRDVLPDFQFGNRQNDGAFEFAEGKRPRGQLFPFSPILLALIGGVRGVWPWGNRACFTQDRKRFSR